VVDTVAYSYYEQVPQIWGLTHIQDQNVGGAIMMIEQSLVLVTVFVVLFVRMLASPRRRSAGGSGSRTPRPPERALTHSFRFSPQLPQLRRVCTR